MKTTKMLGTLLGGFQDRRDAPRHDPEMPKKVAALQEVTPVLSDSTATTSPQLVSDNPDEENPMIEQDLSPLGELSGYVGSCLVDSDSGMMLAEHAVGSFDFDVAAAANTEVVKAKMRAMKALNLDDEIEDILISLGKQYHLIRPLKSNRYMFIYVVLDRASSNLALARMSLKKLESVMDVAA